MRTVPALQLFAVLAALAASGTAQRSAPSAADLEFFERSVRPLFASHCARCHGAEKQRSGLRLDHIDDILRGGSRGPAVEPGRPDDSLLLHAVTRTHPEVQMPPDEPLGPAAVAVLRDWIARGAPWPEEPAAGKTAIPFDLGARRAEHWCWQPLSAPQLPAVRQRDWARTDEDRFVLARLEAAGLAPAADASPAVWLRRVTFDLTGLPPTAAELDAFLANPDADAERAVVDRLLASPHFGEQWARHWLDLMRYAESMGHEYDFTIPNAWRYRDYVVRAWNRDVPFDQFVREHIAGDLLPADERRFDPDSGVDESVQGTAFWWLGEQTHSPVDARKHTADRIDNQIDVFSKAFLGVTVACARCHDHKFDAISQADYYALSGYLKSSRYGARSVRTLPGDTLAALEFDNGLLAHRTARALAAQVPAAQRVLRAVLVDDTAELSEQDLTAAARLRELIASDVVAKDPRHPLHGAALVARSRGSDEAAADAVSPGAAWRDAWSHRRRGAEGQVAAHTGDFAGWYTTESAFGSPLPRHGGDPGVWWDDLDDRPRWTVGRARHSGVRSTSLSGSLQSPEFTIEKRYLHVLAAGREARLNLIVEGFHLLRQPIYGLGKPFVNDPRPQWYTIDCELWQDHSAHLEAADFQAHDLADPHRAGGYPAGGWIALYRAVASEDPIPPAEPVDPVAELLESPENASARSDAPAEDGAALAAALGRALEDALRPCTSVDGPRDQGPTLAQAELIDALWTAGLLGDHGQPALPEQVRRHRAARRAWIASLPKEAVVPGMVDGPGIDEALFVRGDHLQRGELVPRRFLSALGGTPVADPQGSGRLELARLVASADNPLTARVIVNRLWHHLFGRGIVPTVDNFGVLGQPPSHPRLLDHLARQFLTDGWSLKATIRRLVLSRTYRMASTADPAAASRDPDNRLWHHFPVRRLTGENLRDAILAVSGRLDPSLGGPGVDVHLTDFMTGRGRPRGGPVDGAGRRSLYVQVRRNFLSPWMLAFDTPQPFSAVGRRSRTNVPAQALALMNDPLVLEQAGRWAARELAESGTDRERLDRMFVTALARPATEAEASAILDYAATVEGDAATRWQQVAHVLFNLKEFAWVH